MSASVQFPSLALPSLAFETQLELSNPPALAASRLEEIHLTAAKTARLPRPYNPPYLIESILPSTEIHLLAGPTGAGKTRWLFDTLMDWEQGLPVLGHASHPVPWIYIANDRSMDGVNRTLDTMEIARDAFPIVAAWDRHMTFPQIIDAIEAERAQLAIIEGFGGLVDPPCHSHQVRRFLCSTCTILKETGITLIGVVESPKMKPKDTYNNPRQRVSGVATWGHHSETIFLVEPADASVASDPRRILTVCPRNSPGIIRQCSFTFEGHLKVISPGSIRGNGRHHMVGASLNPEDFGPM